MAIFYGYKRLTTIDDWRGLAGDDKWVPGRSDYELAHAWQPAGGLPTQIRDALEQAEHQSLKGLVVDLCLVEKPVFLDTNRARSASGAHFEPRVTTPRAAGQRRRYADSER